MGFLDWFNGTNELSSVDAIVNELANQTKRGEIRWTPLGRDAADVTAGYQCQDPTTGTTLEFRYPSDDERGTKGKRVLIARDGDGAETGTVSLGLAQYVRLAQAVRNALEGVEAPVDLQSNRHRGPFL